MFNSAQVASLVSIVSFIFYGTSCLMSEKMVLEFNRYNLSGYRRLTGILQIAGSVGLALGFLYPSLGKAAALGLALQMLLGLFVRIKIKDSFIQMLPALFFSILNLYILVH